MPHDVPIPIPPENLLEITTYNHRFKLPRDTGERVLKMSVFKMIKGRHKERCLCYRCKKFVPEDRGKNCPIANLLFAVCVQCDIVAPVLECRADLFEEREEPHPWIGF